MEGGEIMVRPMIFRIIFILFCIFSISATIADKRAEKVGLLYRCLAISLFLGFIFIAAASVLTGDLGKLMSIFYNNYIFLILAIVSYILSQREQIRRKNKS